MHIPNSPIQPPPISTIQSQVPIPSIPTSTPPPSTQTSTVWATFTFMNIPLDIFSQTDLLHLIASQVMDQAAYAKWDKITVCELNAYFGFCILMSINHLPAIEDYWRTDLFLHYSPVADRISCYRFREISRFLHFVGNTQLLKRGEDSYDRLG